MAEQIVIGVMGPGDSASSEDMRLAFEVGKLIARMGYVLLTGGRKKGVMDAALKGAKKEGGLTLGILPGENTTDMSNSVDIPIITGMGNARNVINILSSKVVIAIGKGPGTYSEVSIALKTGKPVIAMNMPVEAYTMFNQITRGNFISMQYFDEKMLQALITDNLNDT